MHLIIENFKLYMAIEQCKHIFLGAAGAPRYHSTLELYTGQTDRITLINGSIGDENIRALGLRAVTFNRVFKAGPVSLGSATTMIKPASSEASVKQITPTVSHTMWKGILC